MSDFRKAFIAFLTEGIIFLKKEENVTNEVDLSESPY